MLFSNATHHLETWTEAIPRQLSRVTTTIPTIFKRILKYKFINRANNISILPLHDSCDDEDVSDLVPSHPGGPATTALRSIFRYSRKINNLLRRYVAATTFVAEWDDPTLPPIFNDDTNFTTSSHVVQLDTANKWVSYIIETNPGAPHPLVNTVMISSFSPKALVHSIPRQTTLSLTNPPRRDVAMLASLDASFITFQTDNPGAWLMHSSHRIAHISRNTLQLS